ncbi:kinase-like domain-containing protein [Bisporella sp. PMI_857]|nr:kinase-like domain-containing protein [Bisporella sp. PMI_857]
MERRRRGRAQRSRTTDFSSSPPGPSSNSDPDQLLQILQGFLQKEGIRKKLADATVNRDLKAERFITHKSVERIWKWDILKRFLEILGFENDDTLVELVIKGLLKTLSILVAIRWQKWHLFKTTFLEDGEGPLRTLRHDRNDSAIPYSLENLEDDAFLGKDWAEDFLLAQYTYIPIVVEQGGNEIFPRTRPLPFIRSKSKEIAKGGYGVVTKEVIACHQFRPLLDYTSNDLNAEELPVARKWFSAKGDFRKEARNLAKLNSSLSDHKRIVKYLAVITIGDEQDQGSSKEFNILLPLANTDLKHFLYDLKYEEQCQGVKDLINECAQLSDAVRFLHNGLTIDGKVLICCHMDLKLDNILVYLNSSSPVGCWKISDFGISSMSRREDIQITPTQPALALLEVPSPAQSLARITNTVRTNAKRPPGPFSAPEVELGNEVGRSSDIWSFGCILFQVLARAVGGMTIFANRPQAKNTSIITFANGSRVATVSVMEAQQMGLRLRTVSTLS